MLIRPYDYISTPRLESLDHCLRYAVQLRFGEGALYSQGFKFSPRLGVLLGSFFNAVHRGTVPLANVGSLNLFFKVGIISLQIGLQMGQNNKNSSSHDTPTPGVVSF
jgi:hypothetical protein